MSRIRWYHFYFVLALFDVIVIMISLRLHQSTLDSTEGLIVSASELKEQASAIQNAQQYITELNAPGNDLFSAKTEEDFLALSRRFELAKANIRVALSSLDDVMGRRNQSESALWMRRVANLRVSVSEMERVAERLFKTYRPLIEAQLSNEEREERLLAAGETMSRMDQFQHTALADLGSLAQQNVGYQSDLLEMHKADLDSRFAIEHYIIAFVVLILFGILAFGRRLQQADQALQVERQRVREERRERLAAVGELCTSVAHGIRNPLAAIRSSAQLALELGTMDDDSTVRLRDILTEGQRLGDRVTGLLKLARSNQEGFERIDLAQVVRFASNELKPELTRREIRLVDEITNEEVPVFGDRRHLEQVVIELISNAMEQSRPTDSIFVQCRGGGADGMAIVAVEDMGSGVPESIRPRVFDLFYTTKPSGTGIGLATVKRVARLHGGDVHIRDGRTGGAKFEILLPTIGKTAGSPRDVRSKEKLVA